MQTRFLALLIVARLACASIGQATSGGGGSPTGSAGGDLSGSYPNPTVAKVNGTSFAGTNGDGVCFGASNVPADCGFVPTTNARAIATTSPLGGGGDLSANRTLTCTTCTVTIASGAKALATGAISSAACTSAQTDTAPETAITDTIQASFNADPTAVTGYVPLTTGMLTIIAYPTSNTVNFKVCNNTSSSITPGAITLNWRVVR